MFRYHGKIVACNYCRHRHWKAGIAAMQQQHRDQWQRLGLGEAHHNNVIGLRGWLLNALKIPENGAHVRHHSVSSNGHRDFSFRSASSRDPLKRASVPGPRWGLRPRPSPCGSHGQPMYSSRAPAFESTSSTAHYRLFSATNQASDKSKQCQQYAWLHLARQTIARRNNYANLRMTLTISTILNMPTMLTAIFLEKTGFVGNCTSLFLPRDAMHARYYRHGPVSVCLSVCVCLSQVGVLLKRLNVVSQRQHRTIAQGV